MTAGIAGHNIAYGTDGVPAVRLRGLRLRRGTFAMGPLDCDIPSGCVTALVAPNGSGKSTLFRLLLGMEPILAGEAEVGGVRIGPGANDAYKAGIGFVAENHHAYENALTADMKARFAAHWYPGWSEERYARLMRRFGVERNVRMSQLSKGNRRKAELSVALAHEPGLLLLDEPSSGLDPFAWQTMLDELRRYMETGERTLILATHMIDEVRRLADYILFMYRGRILGLYEKDALLDGWRTLAVRKEEATREIGALLERTPGLQELEQTGPGLFRLIVNEPEAGEGYAIEHGFQVLGAQRMELEDILGCMIRKEESGR